MNTTQPYRLEDLAIQFRKDLRKSKPQITKQDESTHRNRLFSLLMEKVRETFGEILGECVGIREGLAECHRRAEREGLNLVLTVCDKTQQSGIIWIVNEGDWDLRLYHWGSVNGKEQPDKWHEMSDVVLSELNRLGDKAYLLNQITRVYCTTS